MTAVGGDRRNPYDQTDLEPGRNGLRIESAAADDLILSGTLRGRLRVRRAGPASAEGRLFLTGDARHPHAAVFEVIPLYPELLRAIGLVWRSPC